MAAFDLALSRRLRKRQRLRSKLLQQDLKLLKEWQR
jgi:hypothetical protein